MLTRIVIAVTLLFTFAAASQAQTTNTLAWDYDVAPTEVATYTQTVAVDGANQTGTPTCAAQAGNAQRTTCQMTIPALAAGTHTIGVIAARNGMTAETRVTGLNPANGPRSPSSPRLTVTVVVTIP